MNDQKTNFKITYGPSLYSAKKSIIIDYNSSTFGTDEHISDVQLQKISEIHSYFIDKEKISFKDKNVNDLILSFLKVFNDFHGI